MKCCTLLAASWLVLLAPAAKNLDVVTLNDQECGLDGTGVSEAGKDLNRHKNRYQAPAAADIDPQVSAVALLAPGMDVGRFDQEKAATIRGYVINVKVGGNKETCNCGATKPDERDTHIELALAKSVPANQRLIVEVTPRLRMLMKDQDVDWSTTALRKKIKGKWVEVTGWLLFDTMHITEAENTNPGNPGNWRATCWELHPVTGITVLKTAPATVASFRPSSFAALHRLHARHLQRSPNGNKALEMLHQKYLSKFDQKELEEARAESEKRRPKK
jgi:hypothetical protein